MKKENFDGIYLRIFKIYREKIMKKGNLTGFFYEFSKLTEKKSWKRKFWRDFLRIFSTKIIAKIAKKNREILTRFFTDYFQFQFYAPWCGHCKKLEPIWKHVDQSLVGKVPVRVGRIDCTRFTSVATEFSIKGFPTILL